MASPKMTCSYYDSALCLSSKPRSALRLTGTASPKLTLCIFFVCVATTRMAVDRIPTLTSCDNMCWQIRVCYSNWQT